MPSNEDWYLHLSGERIGPISLRELKAKLAALSQIPEDTLVWSQSTVEWKHPREVPDLLESSPAAPLPEPTLRGGSESGNLNPYATPSAQVSKPDESVNLQNAGRHDLDLGTCIETGWKMANTHLGKIVAFGLVYFVIVMAISFVFAIFEGLFGIPQGPNAESPTPSQILANVVSQFLSNLITTFFGIGMVIFGLNVIRKQESGIPNMFEGMPYFISVVVSAILLTVLIGALALLFCGPGVFFLYTQQDPTALIVGAFLLMVPAVYLMVRLGQYQVAIVDHKLGPMDGLRASWQMTQGNFWPLFLLQIACLGIVLLGAIPCFIGWIWALPLAFMANMCAYQMMRYGPEGVPKV